MVDSQFIQLKSPIQECCFISIPRKNRRAIWEVTHYCPHNCKYCFTSSNTQKLKNIEFLQNNDIKIIEKFEKLHVQDVLLTGGEPLYLEEELINIIKILKNKDITFSISTTCTPKKYFEKICNFDPRRINLSFDPKQNIGNNIFKTNITFLKEKLDYLLKQKIPVKLNGVITKNNYKNLLEYSKHLDKLVIKYNNIEKIAIANEYPIGRGIYQKGLTLSELNNNFEILKTNLTKIQTDINFINWPSFNNKLQYCTAGKSIFSVMPDGDIAPCSLLYYMSRSFKTGNIIKDNPNEIIELLNNFHSGVKDRINELKSKNKICYNCENNKGCGGGCFAMMPVLMTDHRERIICKLQPNIITDEQKSYFAEVQKPFNGKYKLPKSSGKEEELDSDLEKKIILFIKENVSKADLAHSFDHIRMVVKLGKIIAKTEKANNKIVTIACYFHDASPRDASMHHFHTINAAKIALDFLKENSNLSDEELLHIKECIISSSHGSFLLGNKPHSIEAKIVRDADLLDAIGARGIARVFAFAAAHGIKEFGEVKYDPERIPFIFEMNLTGPDISPIHHFYTKLLKLKDLILTNRGKELAEERHKFMVNFLRKYANEVDFINGNILQSSIDNWQ